MTSILLLRHAQSTWNAEGRWQGWADPPLSPDGEEAARSAAGHTGLAGIDAAASSDLERAVRTAALLGGRRWTSVLPFRGLRERGAGRWTGLTRAEIEARWPGALGPPLGTIAGGEAPAAATARAVATLHRIAAEWPGRRVLAVTHGGLIRLLDAHLGEEPTPIGNLGGRWVEVDGATLAPGPRLEPLVPGFVRTGSA